jgi:hypothetical protein
MTDKFKMGISQKMSNVVLIAGKKIIQTNNVIAAGKQALAEMRA